MKPILNPLSDTAPPPLKVLLLGVTGHCNLRCRMCSIWQDSKIFLSETHLATLLNDDFVTSHVEYLGITGGEPFLNNRLETVITECSLKLRRLREISITTNGSLPKRIHTLGERIIASCTKAEVGLVFNLSLDGTESTHDLQRGVYGSFQNLISSLENLRKLSCNAKQVSIQISAVLTRWNVNAFTKLLSFAKGEKLRVVTSLPLETTGYYKTDRLDETFYLEPIQKQRLLKELNRLLFAGRTTKSLDPLSEMHLMHLIEYLNGKLRNAPCVFRRRAGCLVTAKGEVFACGGGEEFRLGHLDSESLSAILKRPESRNNRLQSSICDRCPSICYLQVKE